MQVDDPPYLSVGTAVSAKYKGAFCEAKVSKVVHLVKCKVTFKMGLGTAQVSDEHVRGTLRVGHTVQAKHPEKKEFLEAVITKIQDQSQYTVVFDDGDITTLRRSALCMKSGRHFNESETLDQLPLTHPEHFGNPVVGGRRGRRNRQLKEDSSEGEGDEETEPDLEGYSTDIGRVVSVETSDKKRNKDNNWFPGLVVIPSAQPTVRINVKDEYLIRSFKDGRYYTVPKTEIAEFNRDSAERSESCSEAVTKAVKYLDDNELPAHWERNSLFNMQPVDSDSDDNLSESSDDEPNEAKDLFVAQLYKFMDDSGTPLNKSPMISNKDVDLHRLFRAVQKLGGYNRVNNNTKWKAVTNRLKFANNQITCNQVKSVYKKCLLSYEAFYRTLGVTMLNHTRSTKKNRGRSLIRDKDRTTPVNSPKLEKDEEIMEKKEEKPPVIPIEEKKKKPPPEIKKEIKKEVLEMSDTNSSDATDQSEPTPSTSREVGRPKRLDKLKRAKFPVTADKPKPDFKKDEEDKQMTRSKSLAPKPKEVPSTSPDKRKEPKIIDKPTPPVERVIPKPEEIKKRGRKKAVPDEVPKVPEVVETPPGHGVNVGDKLKVYYGPTHEKKVTYEAKVLEIAKDANGPIYCVHYTGWNTRYDEWIVSGRIAENLSATTKAKRLKQSGKGGAAGRPPAGKRGRGMSITGRSAAPSEAPRSTTPSSVTSSSSRTKSPATPATRSASRLLRQDSARRTRRTSAQTDFSNHSESESEMSESESELIRTRSGSKNENEIRTYRKRPVVRQPPKSDKGKEEGDDDSDVVKIRRTRKGKKSPEKSTEESDEEGGTNPPKGRDFDLNQIRSELKGFGKALKVPPVDDKDGSSSSEDSNTLSVIKQEEMEDKKDKSPSSDDIYEFKEPEPFEFESRKPGDDKGKKRLVPRLFEDLEKSPKRTRPMIKSPGKSDKESPPEVEKKRFRRTTPKKDESDDDEDSKKSEDPFDKLVESPSFNLVKSNTAEVNAEAKQKVTRNFMEEPLSLFHETADTVDDYSRDMELSDTESQTQPIFSRSVELFSDTFSKPSPDRDRDRSALDMFPPKSDDLKKSDILDFVSITESINRKIEQPNSSNDDTDDELSITPSMTSYQRKKGDAESNPPPPLLSSTVIEAAKSEPRSDSSNVKEAKSPALHISPALQETDSSLLEAICSSQPILIQDKLEETAKDINLKTGTKIADSILQKFNSIKNTKPGEDDVKKDTDEKIDEKIKIDPPPKVELKAKPTEEVKKPLPQIPELNESKKRRKVLSRRYVEESDSDSSDSEQLVIARSDEDSKTDSLAEKPDPKESDVSDEHRTGTTDDSQSQEEQRNFKFAKREETASPEVPEEKEDKVEAKSSKDDEPDSHLDSLLLCDETIPRSPAPVCEGPGVSEPTTRPSKGKSMLEMPFASAPGSMNNQKMLLNPPDHNKPANKPLQPAPLVLPLDNNRDTSTVLDNTPPTTPESTISNLSPRGDHGDDLLSPNTLENESGKSNDGEADFTRKRRTSSANKPSLFSEEDSQLTEPGSKKSRPEDPAPLGKKRRKSARTSEEMPVKRGRKPLNRSRHNSDSDDTSEHSMSGVTTATAVALSVFDRASRSPRPSKYNFFVEFGQDINSGQRIAILQQKLSELRKTYAEVKAELATVERRRKKIRRREREALKASKQEMASA